MQCRRPYHAQRMCNLATTPTYLPVFSYIYSQWRAAILADWLWDRTHILGACMTEPVPGPLASNTMGWKEQIEQIGAEVLKNCSGL